MKSEKFPGFTYVGLSRVRKVDDLIGEPLTFERRQGVKSKSTFKYRMLEKKRLDLLAENTIIDN